MFLRESTLDLMRASKEVIYEEVPYKYLLGLLECLQNSAAWARSQAEALLR